MISLTRLASLRRLLGRVLHHLGSLKLAVVLLVILAAVIAFATVLETDYGRLYAQWYVYHSSWMIALLALLGVNILCAALVRFPWKRHQTGFVITHCGLLVLLAGSIQSFLGGVEGQVSLVEGESATTMAMPQQTQITAFWAGRPEEPPYEFTFEAGPVDWHAGTTFDVGEVDGVSARVLRYIRHARPIEEWVADESRIGGPAVKLKIEGPHASDPSNLVGEGPGARGIEQLLVDQGYGDEALVGPVRVQLKRTVSEAMLADFLAAPTDLGEKGLLLAYYNDQAARIAVDEKLGQKIALGDSGLSVEIVDYLPNAKPNAHGEFRSANDEPRNPILELRVYVPGKKQSLRQLAFAKNPLLTLDAVYGEACPVKFHYHHPAVKRSTGIELLQTTKGELYCRVCADNKLVPKGKVTVGSRIEMPKKFAFVIAEHLPNAREKITFEPYDAAGNSKEKPQAAAEIEIAAAGAKQKVWLQQNHPVYGMRTLVTSKGLLQVKLGNGARPLGFSLKLVDFRRDTNPGGAGNATFASAVRLVDKQLGIDEERVISMNEPLTHNGLTFYQSGFDEGGHGLEISTFSVAHDPGRLLKYGGCLMICLGIAIMFYMRAYFFKRQPRAAPAREEIQVLSARVEIPGPIRDEASAAEERAVCSGERVMN